MVDICKLCKQKKELINSHIYPKLIFKRIMDNGKVVILNNYKFTTLGFNGFTENLFCKKCDEKLGKYEKYFCDVYEKKINNRNSIISSDKVFYIYGNVNYTKFKLFVLSIAFRSSISKLEFFEYIRLDVKMEEDLRLMLLNNYANVEMKYPITIFKIEQVEDYYVNKIIDKPYSVENGKYFVFKFLGLVFVLFNLDYIQEHLISIKYNNVLQIAMQTLHPQHTFIDKINKHLQQKNISNK